jgi:NADH-quinone oxidoreductase subunit N
MIDKLQFLHPEIALFAATCVVMILGLSRRAMARKASAIVTAVALVVAGWLGLESPIATGALMPALLPYTKTVIAGVCLLILPVLAGTVDIDFEKRSARVGFDPIRATRGEFYAFFLFSVTGIMLCATADDLIWLFLALELTSLPTYIMVATGSSRMRAQEAGVKYFFLGAFGAAMFLYGFALLYGATGTTILPEIARHQLGVMGTLGVVVALIGLAFKIAAVPMHFYAADVYQGAPAPVAAYLAFAPKAAGFLAMLGLLSAVGWNHGEAGGLPEPIRLTLWVMAATTMTVGNVLALLQSSVKRMLAYSSVAHSGYMLVGLIVGPGMRQQPASNGIGAMLLYLLIYGVMTLGAFAVISCLEREEENGEKVEAETFDDLKGLVRQRPLLAWCLVISALSLLGFPPLAGFFGKLALFTSALSGGEIALVIVMALNSAIAAWYYLRLAATPLLDPHPDTLRLPSLYPARARVLAAVGSAVGVIVLSVVVGQLQTAAARAATTVSFRRLVEAPAQVETVESDEPVALAPGRGDDDTLTGQ